MKVRDYMSTYAAVKLIDLLPLPYTKIYKSNPYKNGTYASLVFGLFTVSLPKHPHISLR